MGGALSSALGRLLRCDPPALTCAGRTDAGVHARGQVVHVELPEPLAVGGRPGTGGGTEAEDLARGLNRQLAPAVVVVACGRAPAGFDARRSATARRYRYLVLEAPTPDPLLAPLVWHVPGPLDLRRLAAAADAVIGPHDFRAFCRRPPGAAREEPLVRRVRQARWDHLVAPAPGGRLLRFEIEADSFCHQMVRSLVATLVEVGLGRLDTAGVVARLRAGRRAPAPAPAPPEGLCLEAVRYPDGWPDLSEVLPRPRGCA